MAHNINKKKKKNFITDICVRIESTLTAYINNQSIGSNRTEPMHRKQHENINQIAIPKVTKKKFYINKSCINRQVKDKNRYVKTISNNKIKMSVVIIITYTQYVTNHKQVKNSMVIDKLQTNV